MTPNGEEDEGFNMAALIWDKIGERYYETGIDHGVIYPYSTTGYGKGVAWSGLTGVQEKPTGADANELYADNIKYLEMRGAEKFEATVTAYTYPDEFAILDGSAELKAGSGVLVHQQTRGLFGMAYRSRVGNDTQFDDLGYKLHIVYGATVSPSQVDRSTVNEDPEAIEFSWDMTTTPVEVPGMKPTAHISIDSRKCDAEKLAEIESTLFGSADGDATLLLPADLLALLNE